MKQHSSTWNMRILAMFGILLVAVASVFVAPSTASAAGCRTTNVGENNGTNTNQHAVFFPSGAVDTWRTDWIQSPSWATSCKDVNINNVSVPGDTYGG